MNTNKNDKGFTLVEIIVVLVILAVLAAVAIPTLIGFTREAKGKQNIEIAREIYLAAQAAATESYALKVPNADELPFKDKDGNPCGRISNNALGRVQHSSTQVFTNNMDLYIAQCILHYLGDSNPYDANVEFSTYNPQGMTVNDYTSRYGCPGIVIEYNSKGKIVFVEYGDDGYLIHIDVGGTTSVTENGTFSIYPK